MNLAILKTRFSHVTTSVETALTRCGLHGHWSRIVNHMKALGSVAVSILILTLPGCGSPMANIGHRQNRKAEASGSPFRWKVESVGGGTAMTRVMIDLPLANTKADALLKKDILRTLEKVELSEGRRAPEVEEVRLLSDGREVWILKNKEGGLGYVISMVPSPQGGTDFSINGPNHFRK